FRAWRAIGLKSPSHSNALISPIARDTFLSVACSSSIGVPSSCLCWSHNSGVSTPSVFSQSKNDLGLTLNHLSIVCPRPNVKAIFFPFPFSPPNLHTDSYITDCPEWLYSKLSFRLPSPPFPAGFPNPSHFGIHIFTPGWFPSGAFLLFVTPREVIVMRDLCPIFTLIAAIVSMFPSAYAQDNPYRVEEGWAKYPEGRKWGST